MEKGSICRAWCAGIITVEPRLEGRADGSCHGDWEIQGEGLAAGVHRR